GGGAAFGERAAVLGAGEGEVLAQHLEQGLVRGERRLERLAVDPQAELHVAPHARVPLRSDCSYPEQIRPLLYSKAPLAHRVAAAVSFFFTPFRTGLSFSRRSTPDATHRRRSPQFQSRKHPRADRIPPLDPRR